jgi:hypothetical protein
VSATTFEASLRELTSIIKKVQSPSFADQAPGARVKKMPFEGEGDQIRGFQ